MAGLWSFNSLSKGDSMVRELELKTGPELFNTIPKSFGDLGILPCLPCHSKLAFLERKNFYCIRTKEKLKGPFHFGPQKKVKIFEKEIFLNGSLENCFLLLVRKYNSVS